MLTAKQTKKLLEEINSDISKKKELSGINNKIHSNAVKLAANYLKNIHQDMQRWETKLGPEPGVDIVGYLNDKETVVGEVKTTIPLKGGNRLGGAQAESIKRDLDKMKWYTDSSKYFFILDNIAKIAVLHSFQNELEDIKVLVIKEVC
jgi:hypothetical protein